MEEQEIRNRITQVLTPKIVRDSLDTAYILASPWHYAGLVDELVKNLALSGVGKSLPNELEIGKAISELSEMADGETER